MITIKINGKSIDFGKVSFQIKNDNPVMSENFINDGYSYAQNYPKTARNKVVIRGRELKIEVYWKGFLFLQGNYVLSGENENEYSGNIVTDGSVFRQNMEKIMLKDLPLEVISICDPADDTDLKLSKWKAHMMATAYENANIGSHKFPMISTQGYEDRYGMYDMPQDDFIFYTNGSVVNCWVDGSYFSNWEFANGEKNWTATVAPCPKISYLVEEIIKKAGYILGENVLADNTDYLNMICFNGYVLDKIETTLTAKQNNVHGLGFDLRNHVPNSNCWSVFKMLNEIFGVHLVIDAKRIHIQKSISNLNKRPVSLSDKINNFSAKKVDAKEVSNFKFSYEKIDAKYKGVFQFGWYIAPNYTKVFVNTDREIFNSPDVETTDVVFSCIPFETGIANSQGFFRNYQEVIDEVDELRRFGAFEYLPFFRTRELIKSDEHSELDTEIYDKLVIGYFRGVHNTNKMVLESDESLTPTPIAMIWSYSMKNIYDSAMLALGIDYIFGNASIYLSGPSNAFDYYRLADLEALVIEESRQVSYHLPMKDILDIQKWKNTKHIAQLRSGSFIGIVQNMAFTLTNEGFSDETAISYLILKEQKTLDFYQQTSTSEMFEVPVVAYAGRPFKIKVNSGADSQFTIPTAGTGYDYSLKVAGVVDVSGLTGSYTINFPSANTDYILEVSGLFPQWRQNNNAERLKVKDVMQCGDIVWRSMQDMFYGCELLTWSATDMFNTSLVESFGNMLLFCKNLEADLSTMDVSSAIYFGGFSYGAIKLKFDASSWDVSNVISFSEMFSNNGASITGTENWDMSSAISVYQMIYGNPRWNLANGNNVVKLNTSSALTNIAYVVGGLSPYTNGVTSLEITDCSNVTSATLMTNGAFALARLIPTNLGVYFDISTTALTGMGIDNLADSVADLTGLPSQTCKMGATKIASCNASKWALKNWTLI